MTAAAAAAMTAGSGAERASTRTSSSNWCSVSAPSRSAISRADRPVRPSNMASLSQNVRPSRAASNSPTVVLPEPINPTSTTWRDFPTRRLLQRIVNVVCRRPLHAGSEPPFSLDSPPMRVPPARVSFPAEDRAEILAQIDQALESGQLTLGANGRELEAAFAARHQAKHAIAVSSGTSALEIILRALDVEGRDVLVPANTFFATAAAVAHAGANV